mmetsp:Transcript_40809/g.122947  ORF Transcript_40809/g.122947 Transcript_40809/m.122947 type:complete len:312 (-) Transcript_40809:435-1370(-)
MVPESIVVVRLRLPLRPRSSHRSEPRSLRRRIRSAPPARRRKGRRTHGRMGTQLRRSASRNSSNAVGGGVPGDQRLLRPGGIGLDLSRGAGVGRHDGGGGDGIVLVSLFSIGIRTGSEGGAIGIADGLHDGRHRINYGRTVHRHAGRAVDTVVGDTGGRIERRVPDGVVGVGIRLLVSVLAFAVAHIQRLYGIHGREGSPRGGGTGGRWVRRCGVGSVHEYFADEWRRHRDRRGDGLDGGADRARYAGDIVIDAGLHARFVGWTAPRFVTVVASAVKPGGGRTGAHTFPHTVGALRSHTKRCCRVTYQIEF